MNTSMIIEMTGYLGSALVLISFLMSSVVKLRVINSVGGLIFAVYALLIHSYPTALMNFCLVGINLYYLIRLRHPDRHYSLMEEKKDSSMLRAFLEHYGEDIGVCFPGMRVNAEEEATVNLHGNPAATEETDAGSFPGIRTAVENADVVCFICHDMTPAGILLGKRREGGVLEILLDYSTPEYRDCSVGQYLYSRLPELGVHSLIYLQEPLKHETYLKKMGFTREGGVYVKRIKE